jgi:VanZ family protein
VFSFRNTEVLLRRLDSGPRPRAEIVALRGLIHLLEYGVLGLLAHRALRLTLRGPVAALGLALGVCLAVAVSDETLQARHPNRTSSANDVVLDLLGSSLGMAGSLALARLPGFALPPPEEDA